MNKVLKAKSMLLDCFWLYGQALEQMKSKKTSLQSNEIIVLNILDDIGREDIFDFMQAIIIPTQRMELERFLAVVERRKRILEKKFTSDDNAEVLDALFTFDDFFSEELARHGFMKQDYLNSHWSYYNERKGG